MHSERQPSRTPGRQVSEVVQRIVGRPGSLTQLLNGGEPQRRVAELAASTSVQQEMAQTFPSMYSAPGPSRSLSSYPSRGAPYRQRAYVPRPPKNFLKRVVWWLQILQMFRRERCGNSCMMMGASVI